MEELRCHSRSLTKSPRVLLQTTQSRETAAASRLGTSAWKRTAPGNTSCEPSIEPRARSSHCRCFAPTVTMRRCCHAMGVEMLVARRLGDVIALDEVRAIVVANDEYLVDPRKIV